jgi:hypothetical protein
MSLTSQTESKLIAQTEDSFIKNAVELLSTPILLEIRREICSKVSILYNNTETIREWESFLERVTLSGVHL